MAKSSGALSGSRASAEPSSTVSALTGFDPARCAICGREGAGFITSAGTVCSIKCFEISGKSPSGLSQSSLSQAEPLVPCADDIRIAQYGRSWFSAYTKGGRYLAMGETRREARALALLAIAAALSGCGSSSGLSADKSVRDSVGVDADISVWADPSSGCRYYIYVEGSGTGRFGGMTLRFNRDGSPDCPASADTRPKGGDGTKIAAPFTSGAVPKADAQEQPLEPKD